MERSAGHITFDEKFEYFVYEGEVFRAPLDCPIRVDYPVRNGARWFARSVRAVQDLFNSRPATLA